MPLTAESLENRADKIRHESYNRQNPPKSRIEADKQPVTGDEEDSPLAVPRCEMVN